MMADIPTDGRRGFVSVAASVQKMVGEHFACRVCLTAEVAQGRRR